MAILAEHVTRCAACRRTLLVGEAARTFQDPRTRAIHTICPLCHGRAERAGWQLVGGDEGEARKPLRVQGNGELDHERLVRRLQAELEKLERDLSGVHEDLEGAREATAGRVRREAALRAELEAAVARVVELEGELGRREAMVADAERRVTEAQAAQETLLRARRREADPLYLAGIAVEVFNRSPHRSLVAAEAVELGLPAVGVAVEGSGLPRPIRIEFAWPQGRRAFRVRCDLVARIFEVEDLSHGAGLQPGRAPLQANARLEAGRIALGLVPAVAAAQP